MCMLQKKGWDLPRQNHGFAWVIIWSAHRYCIQWLEIEWTWKWNPLNGEIHSRSVYVYKRIRHLILFRYRFSIRIERWERKNESALSFRFLLMIYFCSEFYFNASKIQPEFLVLVESSFSLDTLIWYYIFILSLFFFSLYVSQLFVLLLLGRRPT